MGWYGTKVLPRIIDATCGVAQTAPLRQRVCAGLTGHLVEIGFGSGHNVPHYPAGVTAVAAIVMHNLRANLMLPTFCPTDLERP